MPASRIVFAIGDLVAEVRRLVPGQELPSIELRLDEPTFMAVVGELENHYGETLVRDQKLVHLNPDENGFGIASRLRVTVKFGGIDIVTELGKPSA